MSTFDQSDGTLQVLTGVDGMAARMGHRLTIGVQTWHADLTWDGDQPAALTMTADLTSLVVHGGQGGLTPLSAPERAVARSNALKTLKAQRFPQAVFTAGVIAPTSTGYRLIGELEICGRRRDHRLDLTVDGARLTARTDVRQSDFGITPFSMMMGSVRVADAVTVLFSASATDSHRAG